MKILNKWVCSIPDYPIEVKISEKRREVFWKHGPKLPKKYKNSQSDSAGFAIDKLGNRILKNVKTANKPRMLPINAQKIYTGLHPAVRSKIANSLHDLFHQAFKKQLPAKIDVGHNRLLVCVHFYDVYSNKLPDLDNLANLFIKCGIDCLTTVNNPNQVKSQSYTYKLGIIPDDKMIFIPHIVIEYTDIKKKEDRRLDFTLYEVSGDFSVESLLDNQLNKI